MRSRAKERAARRPRRCWVAPDLARSLAVLRVAVRAQVSEHLQVWPPEPRSLPLKKASRYPCPAKPYWNFVLSIRPSCPWPTDFGFPHDTGCRLTQSGSGLAGVHRFLVMHENATVGSG